MYLEKDVARGVDGTFMWLMEEVGELAAALREGTREEQAAEFADVLAWLTTIANVVGVDLAAAVRKKYGAGCPGCGQFECACDKLSEALVLKFEQFNLSWNVSFDCSTSSPDSNYCASLRSTYAPAVADTRALRPHVLSCRIGFDRSYKFGHWTPVHLTICHVNPDLPIHCRIQTVDSDSVPTKSTTPEFTADNQVAVHTLPERSAN